MTPARWQQVKEVLNAALGRDPHERAAFISKACRGNESLRQEVESLIISHGEAGSFIEEPAFNVNAEMFAGGQTESLAGRSFGPYEILSKLGAGGMGDVYLAQDGRLGRKVALKLLPAHFTSDADRLRRFQQEARAASALNHPNILTIHEIGQIDDHPFIATEFIDGQTLREHTAKALIKLEEALDVAVQVASALSAAHAAGIVHRDIKPENIMIRHDGFVKVLDFGLVKLTEKGATDSEASTLVNTDAGVVMGTARYMSPEQARGKKVDARTDIWSLGVVLYELVAGRLPFEGGTPSDVLSLILQREPAPLVRYAPEVPTELERIIRKALHKDREERYQTVKDFLIDLKNLRRELQFKAELDRSASPNRSDEALAAMSSGQAVAGTAKQPEVQTSLVDAAHPTSSAEYIVTEIKRYKRRLTVALAVLLLAAVGFGYWFSARRASNATQIESIAVLPFVNASGNSDIEYLSDGLTESLITSLSQLPRLSVKARSTVFHYKGKDVTPQLVGSELSVQAVLNGRVAQRGDQLTLGLELVDTRTGNQIWGEQYNRKTGDLIGLQSEIAHDVSNKLRTKLSGTEEQRVTKSYTGNSEAYQLYLKGRFYWNKRTIDDFNRAIPYFQQAMDKDPNYALAQSGLADSYAALATFGAGPP